MSNEMEDEMEDEIRDLRAMLGAARHQYFSMHDNAMIYSRHWKTS